MEDILLSLKMGVRLKREKEGMCKEGGLGETWTFYTNNKSKEVSNKQEQLENWWVVNTVAAWSSGDARLHLGRGAKKP